MTQDKEDKLFEQRLHELFDRCKERYTVECTSFLDGAKLVCARDILRVCGCGVRIVEYGGFNGAERNVLGLFNEDIYGDTDENELFGMLPLSAVKITGSGFSGFNHRDVLGSVLGLGIKREAVGDIYVLPENNESYVCLSDVAAGYVCESLEFVSRDKVKVQIIGLSELPDIQKKFAVLSGTVASFRLDCTVALCTGLSREKAKQLISHGFVNVNHVEELRSDVEVSEKDVLSIRGKGRFVVETLGDLTKKGRNRMVVHKML